ncbi:MAG: methylated-DNA--[protein]-cysteine S-methyltransferase [Rhizobacter sp.]|nr:methylated-DNA--[protein]-cysteine S-methyltransferase [Bacteriovorax sp.]
MNKIQFIMNSTIGKLYLVASDKGLTGLFWEIKDFPIVQNLKGKSPAIRILKKAQKEVTEYLSGERVDFNLPLDLEGTDFQKKVWAELLRIPYGKTRSYKDIAKKLKDENASRAVGTANGKNPVSLIVPCHRVINTGGSLGGYAGGLHIKTHLLNLEKLYTDE